MDILLGILIPFFGTTIGSASVFLLKNKINNRLEKTLLGFSAGIMMAASIWSLIIPAIEMSNEQNVIAWIPPSIGFLLGIVFLEVTDYMASRIKTNKLNKKSKLGNRAKLIFAVTLHNIPEGMAVGVIYASFLSGSNLITLSGALALSVGIAIQNFPEGAIISIPLKTSGKSKIKSFILGMLSGIVEPIAALFTIMLTKYITPILPYLLAFAAGAMIHVVVEELIPEAHDGEKNNLCIIGLSIGFVVMMILDVALG